MFPKAIFLEHCWVLLPQSNASKFYLLQDIVHKFIVFLNICFIVFLHVLLILISCDNNFTKTQVPHKNFYCLRTAKRSSATTCELNTNCLINKYRKLHHLDLLFRLFIRENHTNQILKTASHICAKYPWIAKNIKITTDRHP